MGDWSSGPVPLPPDGPASVGTVDVGHQVLVLGRDFVVEHLDDVADGDDPDERVVVEDGYLGDSPVGHLTHDLIDLVGQIAGDGIAGHDLTDEHPAELRAVPMDASEGIALAE